MKLVSLGRRSRAAAQETLDPIEVALQPAVVDGRWRVPDRFNFTRDVVEVLAEESRRPALTFLGPDGVLEPRTFRQLAEGASRWAAHLREHGVRPGDRVLVVAGKTPSWIEVMLAGIKVGAVTVPCAPALSATALGIRIAGSGAKVVVAERGSEAGSLPEEKGPTVLYVEDAHELPERRLGEEPTHENSSRDLAFLLTTSGAAGGPYGVEHTHASAFAARLHAEHWLLARSGDVVWCTTDTASPLTVWTLLLGPWSRGAEIVLHEGPFDPAERLDLIRRFDVTILCQPPTEYRALAEAGEKLLARYLPTRLRRMVSAGDFLSSDVVAAFEQAWGLPVEDGYSQAECGVVIGHGEDLGVESGSVGHPLPGYEVVIVDDSGNEVPSGTEGQLALRGRPPSLFTGYWGATDQTKAVLRGDLYLTGDLARLDEDGAVWLLGRAGDIITSGGQRFSPFEVEQALFGHRAVAEAGVVGIRDLQRGGQYVRAFVVLEPGVEGSDRLVAEIRQHLRHTLPEDKVPREVEFVDSLPTSGGKILRHELREWQPLGMEPVWRKAPRLPGTPAPVTTFEAEPEPPPPPPVEDEPLPDFVVPPSETYAAPARDAGVTGLTELEPEEEELPDYIVIPPAPLPEHVVSFLNADPLPNIPVAPEPTPPPRRESRTEPLLKDDPPPAPTPEASVAPPPAPPASEPPAAPAPEPAQRPRARAIPRPIETPKSTVGDPAFAGFGPTPGTKPKPRTRPIGDPSPPPAPPPPAPPAAETPPPVPAPVADATAPPATPAPPPAARPPAPRPAAKAKAPAPAPEAPLAATPAPAKPAAKAPAKPTGARAVAKPASPKPAAKRAAAPQAPSAAPSAKQTPPAKRAAPAKPAARPKAPAAAASPPQAPRKPPAKPKPAAAVPEDNGRTAKPEEAEKKRGLRRRKEKKVSKEARVAAAAEKKAAIQRSAPEPGMENLELDWMKSLSSRLSAYTISPEDEPAAPADSPRGNDGPDAD